jgi:hypothetical protein
MRFPCQGNRRLSSRGAMPHVAKVPGTEQKATAICHVTLKSHAATAAGAAGPAIQRQMAVAGLAAAAWEEPPEVGILSRYCAASWHHPQGIHKVLRRLVPRLPDVAGALFVTLTHDRTQFAGPGSAFDNGRPHIRKVMDRLRKGIEWEGKRYQIDAPYCVKLEFHDDEEGWPHYHLIILTRRFVPVELLHELWGLGLCHVRRIKNDDFHYLLKYVTKRGEYPPWAMTRHRLRIFQPSHGFMKPLAKRKEAPKVVVPDPDPAVETYTRKRASFTIGERLHRWARMALLNQDGHFRTLTLALPFQELFDVLILSIAEFKRYLGNGFIKIDDRKQLIPWIKNPTMI